MGNIPSILTSIKKLLGIEEAYEDFDPDIIIHINSAFMYLHQLGVGPAEGFFITDKAKNWSDYMTEDANLEAVKSYVYLKVRLIFDPPTIAAVLDAMKEQVTEFEFRLNVQADKPIVVEGGTTVG